MTKNTASIRKEYRRAVLDERGVFADPMKQFAAWFDEAVLAGLDEPNAMVLSTAEPGGPVSGRVVLLKGTDEEGFIFYTNYESRKGIQLTLNPVAALTFFWSALERQVRVEGKVSRVSRRESVEYFNSRPLDSRISACVSPQSCVIPDREFLQGMREGFLLDSGGMEPVCPDNWGGFRLKPNRVEFWQGRPHRMHDRLCYRRSATGWILERLAP